MGVATSSTMAADTATAETDSTTVEVGKPAAPERGPSEWEDKIYSNAKTPFGSCASCVADRFDRCLDGPRRIAHGCRRLIVGACGPRAPARVAVLGVAVALLALVGGTTAIVLVLVLAPEQATPREPRLGDPVTLGGQTLRLTFQDEFNAAPGNRTFSMDEDPTWEGIDYWYRATLDEEAYKPGNARVEDGRLVVTLEDVPSWDLQSRRMHKFTSAMLQSWDRLCYTGGYLEARARMPGALRGGGGGGQWGGVWAAGNLGRFGRLDTTEGVWPYSYDQCTGGCDAGGGSLPPQRISACGASGGPGLLPNQGRGAPEMNLFELSVPAGGGPHITTSLVTGPTIPAGTNHGAGPVGCPGAASDPLTYEGCGGLTYLRNHTQPVQPTTSCVGKGLSVGGSTDPDCVGATVGLDQSHFDEFHTYGLLWEPQEQLVWYVDGEPVLRLGQEALGPKRSPGDPGACVGQRDIPTEPMSLLINLALSETVTPWSRDMDFPIEMEVDYVRIYQDESRGHSLGCSPDSHPTAEYIQANRAMYGLPICGDATCDEGECTACPGDCMGNMACPGAHLSEIPTAVAGWQQEHAPHAPTSAACSAHPLCAALALAGDCCPNTLGVLLGCCADQQCDVSFAAEGMRVRATGTQPCTVRRAGLLPTGPLQDTSRLDFTLAIQAEGTGSFAYAVTIGTDGRMCNRETPGCKAGEVTLADEETALCGECEGRALAPTTLGKPLNRIDLSFRFPFFLGSGGGSLRLTVDPGADVLFRHVQFGPFDLPPAASPPSEVLRRGYWAER
mmetsp:Transcript_106552/g.301400  ORF Transcript_106552/g.301400 Transcript_106552/m.301400 type:complete len:786 (+) Transcript_106552:83-2440(+)